MQGPARAAHMASSGNGTSIHLSVNLQDSDGVYMVHFSVPRLSAGDHRLIAGNMNVMFDNLRRRCRTSRADD